MNLVLGFLVFGSSFMWSFEEQNQEEDVKDVATSTRSSSCYGYNHFPKFNLWIFVPIILVIELMMFGYEYCKKKGVWIT